MLITKNVHGYSKKKKLITGRGFVDSLSSIFKSVGSYVSNNKDLIAKPLLGAVGTLAATGLTTGVPALLSHIANRNKNKLKSSKPDPIQEIQLDAKSNEIIQSIIASPQYNQTPVNNIIGSGIKRF
jgi:hypothetical protein